MQYQKGLYRTYLLVPPPGTPIWDLAMEKGDVREDESMEWERFGVTTASINPCTMLTKEFPAITQEMDQSQLYNVSCDGEAQRLRSRRRTFIKLLFRQPWRLSTISFPFFVSYAIGAKSNDR